MLDAEKPEITSEEAVWNYEAMMERMLQNTSIAETIIKLFLRDVPEQLQKLNRAVENGDFKEIRQYSHSIKGSASNLGGDVIRSIAASMEEHAMQKELSSIKTLHPHLLDQYEELEKLLINYVENLD